MRPDNRREPRYFTVGLVEEQATRITDPLGLRAEGTVHLDSLASPGEPGVEVA